MSIISGIFRDAIERCFHCVEDMDETAFLLDRKTQDTVIRCFEVVGEASNNIRKQHPDFVAEHAEIPFGRAIGMRHVLSHGYFLVDLEAVWATVQRDFPDLYHSVLAALKSINRHDTQT